MLQLEDGFASIDDAVSASKAVVAIVRRPVLRNFRWGYAQRAKCISKPEKSW
jgi:hypothetical protein